MGNMMSKEEAIEEFEALISSTEALIEATANMGADKLDAVRNKALNSLNAVKLKLAHAQGGVIARSKASAKAGNDYVHNKPWRSIGIAAGLAALVGSIMGRR